MDEENKCVCEHVCKSSQWKEAGKGFIGLTELDFPNLVQMHKHQIFPLFVAPILVP